MKDEIKEILDRLDFNEWEVDLYKVPITWSELYDIRDYITNLQDTLKDREEYCYGLETQLTNLQEEHKNCTRKHWQQKCAEHCANEMIYKSRNEKAIEFLKHFDSGQQCEHTKDLAIIVEKILQGENKNE